MPNYIVAAGSCHSQGPSYLLRARESLRGHTQLRLCGESKIVKNGSQGMRINRLFYNCAFALSAPMEPLTFYRELKVIEFKLGRIRSYRNAPRTIDLDVLIAFDLIYNSTTFSVPHREFYTRDFFVSVATEAILSAGWPIPLALSRARLKLGAHYLAPC